MPGKNWQSAPKLPCPESDCLPHSTQVAGESTHSGNPAEPRGSCNVCLEEESKECKCENGIENVKDVVAVEHEKSANSSFAHSVINMVGMLGCLYLTGLGQLSTPYALQNGGWASSFLLLGIGIVCAYSSHVLGNCLDKNPNLRNYMDIGQAAFGSKGRFLVAHFIYMAILMSLVSYTISLHDNITTVFLGAHLRLPSTNLSTSQLLTVIAVLVALPSLWLRDLSSISFLSSAGILMSAVIFTSVAWVAIFGGVGATREIPFLRPPNIPAISGLYMFSFTGHIVFPDLYKQMKDPSEFTKVTIVSFSVVIALYTCLAFLGAKMFGPEVDSQITLSMPRHLIVTKIALWATVLTPMTKYALEFAPFAIQLERSLPQNMKPIARRIVRGVVGSILLLVILALALTVPYFEHVLSLTGSLVSVMICLVLPCAFYVKLFCTQMSRPTLILNVIIVLVGCLLGVVGTISSSRLLVRNLREGHSP